MYLRAALKFLFLFFLALGAAVANAQQTGATVSGTISDPDGAVIPGATVTLTPASGKGAVTKSQNDGSYVIRNLSPSTYSLTVTMQGFTTVVKQGLRIAAGQSLTIDTKMTVQAASQEVQVSAQSAQVSVDQDSNASSTVIKGKDLDALSDDPDELSSELSALAGPAAGPNGGQIYVDGFTGGQLPPKSSIREIRVNQNPFSAQYDRLGYGRVEVFTKPGTDKLHGSFQLNGNDSSFNTGNPLLDPTAVQPPYHTVFGFGSITGPISPIASFTLSASRRSIQDNTIVNGQILANPASPTMICNPGDLSCVSTSYQYANPFPQTRLDVSPRVDLALGEKNTLTTRFQLYQSSQTNNGVGGFDLPSTGYNIDSSEYELQVSDTQVLSSRVINETRFELGRNRDTQRAQSTDPTVIVSGAFTSGGSNSGTVSTHQNRLEVQNYTSVQLAKNFMRFGGRLRVNQESTSTTAGTNGKFTYASLDDYKNGKLSQFSLTQVNAPSRATIADVGLYFEDDWKVQPNLTVTYGIRYETQNYLGEHHDFAPRVSFAYGLGSSKGSPKTVLRGGFGLFYDRYQISNIMTTVQSDGVRQQQLINKSPNPACSPGNMTAAACGTPTTANTTTFTAAPNLRTPYTVQFGIGVDQQLFRGATISVNYLNAHGVHQFLSQNVSYGTPAPTQYQYQSEGVFRQNQLMTNVNIRSSRYFTLFGYYALNFANADTAGISYFPSQPGNIGADYGRAQFDVRNRLFVGGNATAPYRITLSPFIVAQSGTPYNVTIGTDRNNDSVFNDRPAFLPGKTSANCSDASSFYVPDPSVTSYTQIPINYCTGPALFTMNLRVSKTFGFGPETARDQGGQGGRGGPGGDRGRGGPGGPGGIFGGGVSTGRRYNLSFGATFLNLFDTENLSTPVGVLKSAELFGHSTQLAGNIYTSNAATRRILLQMSLNF
ncbi:TonB-dependent receptor [Edaphobacter bradus]|uniref:TonB-dependent receptor n=1 Tax=Edaphobacter bradus TaxID=2259016 RepID=UPI0021DFDD28|nr:TonB-dependent receptor [Edaphobacter bradus]